MKGKIIRLSRVVHNMVDSVEERHEKHGYRKNMELLQKCQLLWENLDGFRKDRSRCMRYTYGDQWGDWIKYKGESMTEKAYISMKGNVPLVNNVIRRLVNGALGVYVKSETEPVASARDRDEQKAGEMLTITLQSNWQINKMRLLLANMLEDYLIGGAVFDRETFDYFEGNMDVLSTVPNPNMMFFDSAMSDPRSWDLSLIGQIHDITFNELARKFAHDETDFEFIEGKYRSQRLSGKTGSRYDDIRERHRYGNVNFYEPEDSSLCRVYEVWTKEMKPRYRCHDRMKGELFKIELEDLEKVEAVNDERRRLALEEGIPEEEIPYITHKYVLDNYWYYQFLTPWGDILAEGETPYAHLSHPYVMSLYPFVNGEIHSFVGDFVDQQRYINRLLTIDDFVRRTGAKGVTLVPSQLIPDNMSPEEFAEQWSSVDGLIIYKAKDGVPEPKQFYSSAVRLNTAELVSLQLQMMEDISSVHGAVQGKTPYSGTSASLYAQQAQNSTAALSALMLRFGSFVEDIAVKKIKLIQQYYNEKRVINIAGKGYAGVKIYDPAKAKNILFDVSVKESASTPVHRMLANDMLMEFWKAGAISIEMLLENGDFPFADSLLQSLSSAKEDMANGKSPQLSPQGVQAAKAAADPSRIEAAQALLAT